MLDFLGRYFMLAVFRLLALALFCPQPLPEQREKERLRCNFVLPIKLFLNFIVRGDKDFVWRTVAIPDSFWLLLFIAIRKLNNKCVCE